MHKPLFKRRGKSLLISLCGWLLAVAAIAAVDPFYQSTLSEGTRAYLRNDHPKALKYLRIACFGLLDVPDELGACLTRLALVQAEIEGESAFLVTFARIVEVEERFGGYSQATLSTSERQRFAALLERWVPVETLDSIAAFQAVARHQRRDDIGKLPPKERRDELARRIAEEPREPQWRVMAAELELEKGDAASAMEHLSVALQLAPSLPRARCLWGVSQAVLGRCREALSGLAVCASPPTVRLAEAVIGCHVETAEWARARQLFDQLDSALQQRASLRRLSREIDRGAAGARTSQPTTAQPSQPTASQPTTSQPTASQPTASQPTTSQPTTSQPTASEPPASQPPASQPPASQPTASEPVTGEATDDPPLPVGDLSPSRLVVDTDLPPEAERRLFEAQRLIGSPSGREVMRGFDLAREVADAYRDHPQAQHLTAELAIRLRRWKDAVQYFQRGGEIDPDNAQRLFFYAIALYETGEEKRAADILDQCRDRLQESPFVSSYIAKISR